MRGATLQQQSRAGATLVLITNREAFVTLVEKGLIGTNYSLVRLADWPAARHWSQREHPAVVLVDRRLGDWSMLREHPMFRSVPIVSLESPDIPVEEWACIGDLDSGLDGCLCNQTARQIVARIRAILRRHQAEQVDTTTLGCGSLRMDIARHEVRIDGRLVDLTPREFQILRRFLESPGLALTRQELLNRVWGEDFALEEHALDVHIHALRQKIEEDPPQPKRIVTIRGVGYKLQAAM